MVGTGLEGDVGGGAAGGGAGGGQGMHFRMRLAGAHVPAFAQHPGAIGDHAADHGIGLGGEGAALGQLQGAGHVGVVAGSETAHACGRMSIRVTRRPCRLASPTRCQPRPA